MRMLWSGWRGSWQKMRVPDLSSMRISNISAEITSSNRSAGNIQTPALKTYMHLEMVYIIAV